MVRRHRQQTLAAEIEADLRKQLSRGKPVRPIIKEGLGKVQALRRFEVLPADRLERQRFALEWARALRQLQNTLKELGDTLFLDGLIGACGSGANPAMALYARPDGADLWKALVSGYAGSIQTRLIQLKDELGKIAPQGKPGRPDSYPKSVRLAVKARTRKRRPTMEEIFAECQQRYPAEHAERAEHPEGRDRNFKNFKRAVLREEKGQREQGQRR